MGGRAHNKGSRKMKAIALAEARRLKPKIQQCMRENRQWSAPSIAGRLNAQGYKKKSGTKFTARIVKCHMQKVRSMLGSSSLCLNVRCYTSCRCEMAK